MNRLSTTKQAAELLRSYEDVFILCHTQPDGDTVGSAFALCHALRGLGKRAAVRCSDRLPLKYVYLTEKLEDDNFEPKNIVTVDIASPSLLGVQNEKFASRIDLCIDHHKLNTLEPKNSYIEPRTAATCQILFKIIKDAGCEITSDIADALFTGITTDTGCFKYASAGPETLRVAAELMELGANSGEINRINFDCQSKGYMKMYAKAVDGLEFFENGKIAITALTQKLLKECELDESEVEGIAAMPRTCEGVYVGITLRELKDGSFKASVRTRDPIDAAAIALKLGGGGHVRAAGCQLKDVTLEQAKAVLLDIAKAVC
jgi:phosphoesterase RecJ-like protein